MSDALRRITELVGRLDRRVGMSEYDSKIWKDYINKRVQLSPDVWHDHLTAPPHNIGKLLALAFCSTRMDIHSDAAREEVEALAPYVSAFWQWRESKIVYKFGKDVEKALLENTALAVEDNVPVEALACLPHKHFFIESSISPWTDEGRESLFEQGSGFGEEMKKRLRRNIDNILGYVVNLDPQLDENLHELPNGYLSISTVVDAGDDKPPFLPSTTFRLPNGNETNSFLDCIIVDASGEADEEKHRRIVAENHLKPLQLILYLCAENAVLRPRGSVHKQHGRRIVVAKKPSPIDVLLPEISKRSFPPSFRGVSDGEHGHSGRVMPPHERRAHWHSFWVGGRKGSEKAKLVLRWLAPILVHGGGEGERVVEISVKTDDRNRREEN